MVPKVFPPSDENKNIDQSHTHHQTTATTNHHHHHTTNLRCDVSTLVGGDDRSSRSYVVSMKSKPAAALNNNNNNSSSITTITTTIDDIMTGTVKRIPTFCSNPDATCARISYIKGEHEIHKCTSDNFSNDAKPVFSVEIPKMHHHYDNKNDHSSQDGEVAVAEREKDHEPSHEKGNDEAPEGTIDVYHLIAGGGDDREFGETKDLVEPSGSGESDDGVLIRALAEELGRVLEDHHRRERKFHSRARERARNANFVL
jgi:hypothetical protein